MVNGVDTEIQDEFEGQRDEAGNIIQEPLFSSELDSSIGDDLEKHLDSLPDEAKEFIFTNLTDQTVTILGLILGPEALQFFANTQGITNNQLPSQGQLPNGVPTGEEQSGGFIDPSANTQQPSGSFI